MLDREQEIAKTALKEGNKVGGLANIGTLVIALFTSGPRWAWRSAAECGADALFSDVH